VAAKLRGEGDPHGNESPFPFVGLRYDRALPRIQAAIKT